ncbi:embryo defective 1745, A. thaliana homolog of yeast GLE1 [Hibiscus trionum]|uniref:mRNA export factor GLE1 n=1 Tax=Hibiscus trionum TaxID=183268 RepID=A0A9W7MT27_HIBTR|nr:embryo defective 1745, A. thaliana homolog of yeast GLE1 [Hibiscus trionum]
MDHLNPIHITREEIKSGTTVKKDRNILKKEVVKLQIPCPQSVNGVGLEPDPDWSFRTLLSELDALEKKLNISSSVPLPFTKTKSREFYGEKGTKRTSKAFVMKISDEEFEDSESENEEVRDHDRSLVKVARFNCDEVYFSSSDDDSDDKPCLDIQPYLMNEVGLVESALYELTHEHQLGVKEEIRNAISALETDLTNESEESSSAHTKVEKYREARREVERKFDVQYQRRIAEGLDNHLTAVQRDHELKSQIEERRIRNDAAHEEAKRREKALQEERLRQEKAKAEAEAKLKAEEANRIALEAKRIAAKEAAEKEAAKAPKAPTSEVPQTAALGGPNATSSGALIAQSKGSGNDKTNKSQSAGNMLRAADSALNLERERLQKLKELEGINQSLRSSSNEDFGSTERHIARLIRQIRGTKDSVTTKATELVKIFNNPRCPQTISIASFAKKVVSHCESPDSAPFACGHVIILVTSQFPQAMDLLVAELQRACIYTVPKHISYSKSAFESKEAYWKVLGYQEEDGKIESKKDYLKRLESYVRLYGALVQTEVAGRQNVHGLKEGWAWLARFLNALPANIYTAVALNAFLQTAGFGLYRKYKSQFMKLLNIVSENFLNTLRSQEDPELRPITADIQSYLEDKKFLVEPEGRSLQGSLLSSVMVPDSDYQAQSFYQHSRNYF